MQHVFSWKSVPLYSPFSASPPVLYWFKADNSNTKEHSPEKVTVSMEYSQKNPHSSVCSSVLISKNFSWIALNCLGDILKHLKRGKIELWNLFWKTITIFFIILNIYLVFPLSKQTKYSEIFSVATVITSIKKCVNPAKSINDSYHLF